MEKKRNDGIVEECEDEKRWNVGLTGLHPIFHYSNIPRRNS
jgi:hypothetical protein